MLTRAARRQVVGDLLLKSIEEQQSFLKQSRDNLEDCVSVFWTSESALCLFDGSLMKVMTPGRPTLSTARVVQRKTFLRRGRGGGDDKDVSD